MVLDEGCLTPVEYGLLHQERTLEFLLGLVGGRQPRRNAAIYQETTGQRASIRHRGGNTGRRSDVVSFYSRVLSLFRQAPCPSPRQWAMDPIRDEAVHTRIIFNVFFAAPCSRCDPGNDIGRPRKLSGSVSERALPSSLRAPGGGPVTHDDDALSPFFVGEDIAGSAIPGGVQATESHTLLPRVRGGTRVVFASIGLKATR